MALDTPLRGTRAKIFKHFNSQSSKHQKRGPGISPAVGGGEWILRREEGVVGIPPPLSLNFTWVWAKPRRKIAPSAANEKVIGIGDAPSGPQG
jgi:hypothetical protein